MEKLDTASEDRALAQLLPGFVALPVLWQGEAPPFPSEDSARWALKHQRKALMDANALALHRGRIFVHRARLLDILRNRAIEAYKMRYEAASP